MEREASDALSGAPFRVSLFDGLADRFVTLLGLPQADAEARDIAVIVHAALETAHQTNGTELLSDALRFAEGRLRLRGRSDVSVRELGAALLVAAGPALRSAQGDRLRDLLERSAATPVASPAEDANRLSPVGEAYLEHLVRGDRKAAVALTRRCVTEGMDASEVLLDVLEPVQREVGRRWALGLLSIAQEHFCTAVTEFAMTDLYPGIFTGEWSERRLLAIQAPGSLHQVGLRMVTDVLECRGWSTTYVGEVVAVDDLPALIDDDRADLLLISASMPSQIGAVTAMIRAVRRDPRTQGVKVVVGGRPFLVAPDLVAAIGADGSAQDARSAVAVCDALMGGEDGPARR